MRPADFWKPTHPDFIRYPYDAYREIRKTGNIFKANTGDYVVMDYQNCKRILQDPSFETGLRYTWTEKMATELARKNDSFDHVKEAVAGMLVQINPPEQQQIRSTFAKSWPSIHELKETSEQVVNQVIDELPTNFDAISQICRKIPLQVISRLIGLPVKEVEDYAMDGINLVQILSPYLTYRDIKSISDSTSRLQTFFRQSILSDDYAPTRLTEKIIADYREKEMINLLLFVFIAGYETTSSLLALCLHNLISNKDDVANIKKYGAKPFINEMLRLHSPVQITGRVNTESVELDGQFIPKNSSLTVCLGAANVDPAHFEKPEEFVWNRTKREHLSFGYGMHFCLGNQLAEIEVEILIEKLLPILDRIKIVNEPVLRDQFTIKSYQSFDLAFT
ncbi:cytochrome P450 [Ekhidna sp.]